MAGALKTLVYTFQRIGEIRHMKWQNVDLESREWIFTANKVGTSHLVPFLDQMGALLKDTRALFFLGEHAFPNPRILARPISDVATNVAVKVMGINTKSEITSHGHGAVARTLLHEKP